jgi:hypothetical protein
LRERVVNVVPIDEAGVRARFALAASAVLGKSATARLAALIDNLETVVDAAALSRATRLGSFRAAPSKAAANRAVKKRKHRKSSR